jgi:hypothetical protein
MEFFRTIEQSISEQFLTKKLNLKQLEAFSNQMFILGEANNDIAKIGTIWGEFTLIRTEIKGGLRFALKECPNALTWTTTTNLQPNPNQIVIHLTINRKKQSAEFIEEINAFLDDLKQGITSLIKINKIQK